ncbi:type II methionyl aminopeptidase [Candidatus Pacearchaeota archaeon]|nr:type II methionyl aminopeptidase [Candidatus Pacearchaeota archaeon]MBD3283307.1 type II methionyl aminopeptidase [Candidatus Pacearchaeota archaeon]
MFYYSMDRQEIENYKKAGDIAKKTREYIREITKPGILLVELAKKIENKITELGGSIAFPVNLSIDDIAAHYHPTLEDNTKASGLLKIDFGVHIDGFIADTAMTIDLTEDKRHKELIEASEEALKNALKIIEKNPTLNEIGREIQETIEKKEFSPIINLSGHSLAQHTIHAGITIPNYSNGNQNKLNSGAYAIEPFATSGEGKIYEGPSGNIFSIVNLKNTRNSTARKLLEYAYGKYKTLPFSLREMQEKFGNFAKLALRELEQAGIVHNYPQLIEKSHKPVSQAEHTFIKTSEEIIITTKQD